MKTNPKLYGVLLLFLLLALLSGCSQKPQEELSRPEFDMVQITYEDNSTQTVNQFLGPDITESKETTDSGLLDKVWEIYAALDPSNSNPPMDFPRYRISFLNDGAVVTEWLINGDGVVACAERWGPGNKTLKDSSAFEDIDAIWKSIDK